MMTGLPAWAETPFEASQRFLEANQITEARRALESELRLRPNNVDARYNLAVLLQEIGDHQQAAELYEQNLQYIWHLPSLINLASIHRQAGRIGKAEKLLLEGTKKIKNEATPWYILADLADKRGNRHAALNYFARAIKVDPLNGFAWLYYADFQSRHILADKGLKHAAKAMRLLPNCAPCWRKYGKIIGRTGDHEKALAAYQRSLAIQPDTATREQLIATLRSLGHTDRANRMQQGLDAWKRHQAE